MKALLRIIALTLALSGVANAQQPCSATFSDHTVAGRLGSGTGAGPCQAIPFASLGAALSPYMPAIPGSPGVDTNVLNAQTSAYSALSTDCGKTITLAGSAFYALTVGVATGFPATCSIVVANIDSGRGKTMTINGVSFPNSGILWPGQSFTLKNENNVWTVIHPPGRWKNTAAVEFYVDKLGSNSNDGLASGSGGFLTISGALSVISGAIDNAQNGLTVQVDCSSSQTFSENLALPPIIGAFPNGSLGSASPTLIGNTTTPTNCNIAGGSPSTILATNAHEWIVEGFNLTNTAASCIIVDQGGWIRLSNITYGSCNGSSSNLNTVENGASLLEVSGNITITNSAFSFVDTTQQGHFLYGSGTITLSGTPAFTYFAVCSDNSLQYWGGATFSGSATGSRYNASLGCGIDTNGGGPTFLPGNSGGTATNPGWYN